MSQQIDKSYQCILKGGVRKGMKPRKWPKKLQRIYDKAIKNLARKKRKLP